MADRSLKEQEYFLSNIKNLFLLCDKLGCPRFSPFLSEEQRAVAEGIARKESLPFLFWGGYEGALRVMLGVFPSYMEPDTADFPIVGVTAVKPSSEALTHRDCLGSLMAQQIKRETIGDILIEADRVYIFGEERVKKVLLTQIDRIGRVGVTVSEGVPEGLERKQEFNERKGSLASLRLDAAVSLAAGVSREKAALFISGGLVFINGLEKKSASAPLKDGDVITVRGHGKFLLKTDGNLTRRGRVAVTLFEYR